MNHVPVKSSHYPNMLAYLFVVVLLLIVLHVALNYNAKARMLNKLPGPAGAFIIGNANQVNVSSVELMKVGRVWADTYNGIYRIWAPPLAAVNVYNPEDVELIISSMKFNDKSLLYQMLKPWLRDGLLVSKGEKWQQRRKLLTPAFHFNILREFYFALRENSQLLVEKLEKSEGTVDVAPIMSEYTLHSICETAMGTKLSDETSGAGRTYKNAVYDLIKVLVYRFLRVYLHFDFVFNLTSASKKLYKHLEVIHRFTQGVIKDRRDYINKYGVQLAKDSDDDVIIYKNKRRTALLDLLLLAERDGHIDNEGIQEEVDTFMFEGHDTTASGLTFCLLSLANDQSVQDKVVRELRDIFGDSTRPATMDDLTKMKYLELCIKESLRLYPPVHFISRSLNEDVVLSGYKVPKNTFCHINILDLHRNQALYENPLEFNPDRFLPENSSGRHPYAYIPFSAGPRNCIGQKFAMMEMKSAVSEILRKFELRPVTRHADIEFVTDMVLRNSKPVYVNFIKR